MKKYQFILSATGAGVKTILLNDGFRYYTIKLDCNPGVTSAGNSCDQMMVTDCSNVNGADIKMNEPFEDRTFMDTTYKSIEQFPEFKTITTHTAITIFGDYFLFYQRLKDVFGFDVIEKKINISVPLKDHTAGGSMGEYSLKNELLSDNLTVIPTVNNDSHFSNYAYAENFPETIGEPIANLVAGLPFYAVKRVEFDSFSGSPVIFKTITIQKG